MGPRETPGTLRGKGNKTVRFSDTLVNTDELDNQQVLQLHRRVMEEQDQSLDRLSESIQNQRELSIQIGDELDSHVQLLDDVDDIVDRHQDRLHGAKKRLNHVAKTAKDNGMFTGLWAIGRMMLIIPNREFGGYCSFDYYTGTACNPHGVRSFLPIAFLLYMC